MMSVISQDGDVCTGMMPIAMTAPGLFTANANGQGVAAAVALRVKGDGSQSYEPVARFNSSQNQFVPVPIHLGPETDQVILILFGTGIRFRTSLAAVGAKINGVDAQVLYAREQGSFIGLDQVNLRLPRSLMGRGEIDVALTVDGKTANPVKIHIQ